MNTDPVADMLTRIRNAIARKHALLDVPLSRFKLKIVEVLRREGFIRNFKVVPTGPHSSIRIYLKYIQDNRSVITGLKKRSKPGRRFYVGKEDIPKVRGGVGIAILSTSKGLLTDRESRKQKVGGEVLCYIW